MASKRQQAMELGMKRFNAVFEGIREADAPAAKAAKERAEARKAKYPPTETTVRYLRIPRGSTPWTHDEIAKAFEVSEDGDSTEV